MVKRILLSIGLLACLMPVEAQEYTLDSLVVDGNVRKIELYRPAGMKPGAPMLVVLNGYMEHDELHNKSIVAAADKHKFAVCWTLCLVDSNGQDYWNVGYPFQAGWEVDDVKAVCAVARYVRQRYNLSLVNTFLTGMSHGGELCYLMGYRGQDVFKVLMPMAGLNLEWMYRTFDAPKPIPIFAIHGSEDHTSPVAGNLDNGGKWGTFLSVPMGINYWVARDKCMRETCDTVPSIRKKAKNVVIRHKYTGGTNGCEVWSYINVGGGHGWQPFDIDLGEEMWNFFSRYME